MVPTPDCNLRIFDVAPGRFAAIDWGRAGTMYVQTWGFANTTDLGMGMAGLTVVGEKQITIVADVLTSTALTPRSGP